VEKGAKRKKKYKVNFTHALNRMKNSNVLLLYREKETAGIYLDGLALLIDANLCISNHRIRLAFEIAGFSIIRHQLLTCTSQNQNEKISPAKKWQDLLVSY